MSHFFTEEQLLFRDAVREFVDQEVRPAAAEIDRTGEFPQRLWERCGELGLTGIMAPEEYGGLGDQLTTELMVMEELGRACPALALILDVNCYTLGTLLDKGSEEQKQKYVPDLASGKKLGGLSMTEGPGSLNFKEWPVGAVRDGSDFVVNCTKLFQTNSVHSDVIVITVLTEEGLRYFLLDMDSEGISRGFIEHKMGLNGSDSGSIVLKNVRIPESNMLKGRKRSHDDIPMLDVAAICLGIAQEAYDKTAAYLKARTKQGQPLESFSVLGHELVKMATEIELARNLVYNGGRMFDEGQNSYVVARMAKMWVSEMAVRTVSRCIELQGAVGYCEDTGLSRLLRDAQGLVIVECSSHIQSAMIQAGMGIKVKII